MVQSKKIGKKEMVVYTAPIARIAMLQALTVSNSNVISSSGSVSQIQLKQIENPINIKKSESSQEQNIDQEGQNEGQKVEERDDQQAEQSSDEKEEKFLQNIRQICEEQLAKQRQKHGDEEDVFFYVYEVEDEETCLFRFYSQQKQKELGLKKIPKEGIEYSNSNSMDSNCSIVRSITITIQKTTNKVWVFTFVKDKETGQFKIEDEETGTIEGDGKLVPKSFFTINPAVEEKTNTNQTLKPIDSQQGPQQDVQRRQEQECGFPFPAACYSTITSDYAIAFQFSFIVVLLCLQGQVGQQFWKAGKLPVLFNSSGFAVFLTFIAVYLFLFGLLLWKAGWLSYL